MPDWLHGPKFMQAGFSSVSLRNLTLDIDTLFDLADEIPSMMRNAGLLESNSLEGFTTEVEYRVRGRLIDASKVRELGVPDRNQLEFRVVVARDQQPEGHAHWIRVFETSVTLNAPTGMLSAGGSNPTNSGSTLVLRQIADRLYENGDQVADWPAVRWVWSMIPIPVAIAAWAWVAIAVELPVSVHVLILAIIALGSVPLVQKAMASVRAVRLQQDAPPHWVRFRGESRKETIQRRADTHENLKVGAITLVAGALLGVLGTLLTTALTGG